jgi:ribonuclease-3
MSNVEFFERRVSTVDLLTMPDQIVIFRTHSDIEAQIVRGLLEAHGVLSVISSDVLHSIFPLSVDGLGEVRIAVHHSEADEARRIIEGHRTELKNGQVLRLRDEFDALEQAISYRFRDRGLLEHAMTHTSRANEDQSGGVADNESLEFLGDAVLGFIIADWLFRDFPDFDEGQKSKIKASLVSASTLARQAERLGLGNHLLLGRGEEKTGGRRKQALLADGYEALIAAIYLDGGVEQVRAFITREFGGVVGEVRERGLAGQDHKSALQELLQARELPLPDYRLAGTLGPDHQKLFRVQLAVNGEVLAEGTGSSKKEAEQEAARLALEKLESARE